MIAREYFWYFRLFTIFVRFRNFSKIDNFEISADGRKTDDSSFLGFFGENFQKTQIRFKSMIKIFALEFWKLSRFFL